MRPIMWLLLIALVGASHVTLVFAMRRVRAWSHGRQRPTITSAVWLSLLVGAGLASLLLVLLVGAPRWVFFPVYASLAVYPTAWMLRVGLSGEVARSPIVSGDASALRIEKAASLLAIGFFFAAGAAFAFSSQRFMSMSFTIVAGLLLFGYVALRIAKGMRERHGSS